MYVGRMYPYFNNDVTLIQRIDHCVLESNPGINGCDKYRLNTFGAEITKRCDGSNSLQEIILDISNTFEAENFEIIEATVNFLNKLGEYGLLSFSEKKVYKQILLKGDPTEFIPIDLTIELTDYCNLKCNHCYRESGPHKKEFINTNKLLLYLKKLTSRGLSTIHITGGEPLAHPDIITILEETDKLCKNIVLLTNGTLINNNIINILSKISNKLIIQIDLDGNSAKPHDELRGISGSFDRVCSSAKKLRDNGISFSVAMNVYPENLELINQTLILSQELGASSFTCSPIIEIGRASHSMILSTEQSIQLFNTLKMLYSEYPDFINKPKTTPDVVENRINCGAGSRSLVLSPLGNLRPCPILGEEHGTFGNIFAENNSEITEIEKQMYSYFLELQQPKPELCGDCDFTSLCYGCFAHPILYNDLFSHRCKNFSCLWNKKTGFIDFMKNLATRKKIGEGVDNESV